MNSLFYFFSTLLLLAGVMVIQSKNPVHSVLFLILVFFNAAGLLILLGLDFFAMIFLVVYVGAIAVLFLFVVMMLNIKLAEINEKKLRYLPVGGLLGILFLLEIFLIVNNDLVQKTTFQVFINENNLLPQTITQYLSTNQYLQFTDWSLMLDTIPNIEAIGMLIYTYYFYFFLMASLILLVAMIGAIVLTMHKSVYVKRQQVFKQNTREFSKTVNKYF